MGSVLDHLDAYTDYMRYERMMSDATIAAYRSDLRNLARYYTGAVADITTRELRGYMRELGKRGLKPKTINRHFNGFTTYWHWLVFEGLTSINPVAELTLPRIPLTAPHWLTNEELRAFYRTPVPTSDPDRGLRDSVAWSLLAWLGIRRGELINLRCADVDVDGGLLTIRASKNKRDRILPLPDTLREPCRALLVGHQSRDFLLRGVDGQQWRVKALMRAFHSHLRRCGLLGRGITPHWLRHTFATNLRLRGIDVVDVQGMLGHADLKSTMRYVHFDTRRLGLVISENVLNDL